MNAFTLKLFAMLSMLIDHSGYLLYLSRGVGGTPYLLLRSLGRPSFVLFAFLLVNGFEKTHDIRRYIKRLLLFAVLSQPAFTLAFTAQNYRAHLLSAPVLSLSPITPAVAVLLCLALLAYFFFLCAGRAEPSLLAACLALFLPYVHVELFGLVVLDGDLNVFYTLALSLLLIAGFDRLARALETRNSIPAALAAFAAALACVWLLQERADYGLKGMALIAALALARRSRWAQAGVIALWCVWEYVIGLHSWIYALCAASALVPVLLYNGRRGPAARGLYWVYPVHLYLFSLLGILLSV